MNSKYLENICSICIDDLDLEKGLNINCCACNKLFHQECLKQWYLTTLRNFNILTEDSVTCPQCRYSHVTCIKKDKGCKHMLLIKHSKELNDINRNIYNNNLFNLKCITATCTASLFVTVFTRLVVMLFDSS